MQQKSFSHYPQGMFHNLRYMVTLTVKATAVVQWNLRL